MSDERTPATREERLAQKLRENLKRRKAQARALSNPEVAFQEPGPLPKEQGDS